ncbi:helix-turn-helix domain-containing protein [Roseomonas chloroacetimidivorans]|uniref:helix-turn-helix domain-containing protein n=1 Tax=Roseomonas chloroacetimidivorans TaxID=1766656 RepID=UPI003C755CC2
MAKRPRRHDYDAVLALARQGKRPSAIAMELGINYSTVRDIVRRAQKAGVESVPCHPRGRPRGPGSKVWTAPSRSPLYRKLRYAGGLPREEVLPALGADRRAAQGGEGATNALPTNSCNASGEHVVLHVHKHAQEHAT